MTGTNPPSGNAELWEAHSEWWQRQFTEGADPEYTEQILPIVAEWTRGYERVLEVGTGEGQVARHVVADGDGSRFVVGLDPTVNQIVEARRRGGGVDYLRSGAEALPFADASFDAVVCCLVFEHIDDLDEALAEVARVLRPGGRFVFCLNHPLISTPGSGWIDDHVLDPPEQYWRIGPYLAETEEVEQVEKGVFIRFLHRPLGRYVNTMADVGLRLERLLEPPPPPGFLDRAPEYGAADTIPRLLTLVATRG
ncbi:MAG: class I SAM-dependent methyltransferase [Acidimicrobiales bacterium]|jgi:SAM-dependent methyltransferase|nr:class I SAM-dependent methyltransferase [Acidimicrobiales bacterium]